MKKDVFIEDYSIAHELKIEYQYLKLIDKIMLMVYTLIAILVFVFLQNYLLGLGFLALNLFVFIDGKFEKPSYKTITINNKCIILNKNLHLPWSEIYDEKIIREGSENNRKVFLFFCCNLEDLKIDLMNYNVNPEILKNYLRTYRIQFNKKGRIRQ